MISGERQKVRQKAVRWPCGVCSNGVGSNLLKCTSCQKWVHKKCSGSMSKVAKSFICSGCLNPLTSAGRTSVDIGASAKLECRVWYCLRDPMSSRFSKTPTCDRQTDGHRAMASNAGA